MANSAGALQLAPPAVNLGVASGQETLMLDVLHQAKLQNEKLEAMKLNNSRGLR